MFLEERGQAEALAMIFVGIAPFTYLHMINAKICSCLSGEQVDHSCSAEMD